MLGHAPLGGASLASPGGPASQTLEATRITSGNTFGTHTLQPLNTLVVPAITDADTIGSHAAVSSYPLVPTRIVNSSSFGTITVTAQGVLDATLYANGNTFGTHVFSLNLTTTIFANTAAFGTHVASAQNVLSHTRIQDNDAFWSHNVFGTNTVTAPFIVDPDVFEDGHVLEVQTTITATRLVNTSTFGTHAVDTVNTLDTSHVSDGDAFGVHVLASENALFAPFDVDPDDIPSPSVSFYNDLTTVRIVGTSSFGSPTILVGPVDLTTTRVADADSFKGGAVDAYNNLTATRYVSTPQFGAHAFEINVGPTTRVVNTSTFGSPTAAPFNPVVVPHLLDLDSYGSPTVAVGPVAVVPALYANTNTFGATTVTQSGVWAKVSFARLELPYQDPVVTLRPALLASTNSFGTPTLETTAALAPTRLASTTAFGSHSVVQNVGFTRYVDTDSFGTNVLQVTDVTITATRIVNVSTFGSPSTDGSITVSPVRFVNNNWFGGHALAAADTNAVVPKIVSTNTFGAASLAYVVSPILLANTVTVRAPTAVSEYTLSPSRISSGAQLYAPSAAAFNVVTLTSLTNTSSFGTHALVASYTLSASTLVDDDAVRGLTLTALPPELTATRIVDGDTISVPAVVAYNDLTAQVVSSTNTFGAHALRNVYGRIRVTHASFGIPFESSSLAPSNFTNTNSFGAATVLPGAVTVTSTAFTDADTIYPPQNVDPFYNLNFVRYADADTFRAHALVPATLTWTATRHVNTSSFYAHVVAAGAVTLAPTRLIDPTDTFYNPSIELNLLQARVPETATFGSHVVATDSDLTADVYANTSTFGTAVVEQTSFDLSPALYADPDEFYSPSTDGTITLRPTHFAGAQAFGSHTILVGDVALFTSRIVSPNVVYPPFFGTVLETALFANTNTFGTHVLAAVLQPVLVPSAVTFGTHALVLNVTATRLVNTTTFRSHTLQSATTTLTATRLVNGTIFRSHIVQGANTLVASHLPSTTSFGVPAVVGNVTVDVPPITSASTFGTHSLRNVYGTIRVTQAYITLPAVEGVLLPTCIASTNTFGASTIRPADWVLTPTRVVNTNTFGTHTVSAYRDLTLVRYADADTFYATVVSQPASNLSATLYADPDTFRSHTLVPGAILLAPSAYGDPDAFGATSVVPADWNLSATTFTNTSTFGAPEALRRLDPPAIGSTNTFGAHTVIPGDRDLAPPLVADGDSFGAHVSLSIYYLDTTLVPSSSAFFTDRLQVGEYIAAYVDDADIFYGGTLVPGPVDITATHYGDGDTFPGLVALSYVDANAQRIPSAAAFFGGTITVGPVDIVLELKPTENRFGNTVIAVDVGPTTYFADGDSLYPPLVTIFNPIDVPTIASTTTFGSHTVLPGPVTLTATRYADADVFGTTGFMERDALSYFRWFNTSVIYPITAIIGAAPLNAARFVNTTAFGATRVTRYNDLDATRVPSASVIRSHTLQPSSVPLTAPHIPSTAVVYPPDATGTQHLTTTKLASGNVFRAHILKPADVNVTFAKLASTNAFFTPVVVPPPWNVWPYRYTFGGPTFYGPTVSSYKDLSTTVVTDADGFLPIVAFRGIVATHFANFNTFFSSHDLTTTITTSIARFADADAFRTITVERGPVTLGLSGIASTNSFGTTVVDRAEWPLSPTRVVDGDTFGGPTAQAYNDLGAPHVDSGRLSILAPPTVVNVNGVDIVRYPNPDQFYAVTLTVTFTTKTLWAERYADPDVFHGTALVPGATAITGSVYADPDVFGIHTTAINLSAARYANDNTFGAAVVAGGDVTLSATLFIDDAAFPRKQVNLHRRGSITTMIGV